MSPYNSMAKIVEPGAFTLNNEQNISDAQLISRCIDGDSTAWEILFDRYKRLIYSFPVQFGFSKPRIEDIFQKVSILLFNNLQSIKQPDRLSAWIATTTKRECYAYLRKPQPVQDMERTEHLVEPEEIEPKLLATEREHLLHLALREMEEPCRTLISAAFFEEPPPSYEEIAKRINRPVGSLGPTRARCLQKLEAIYRKLGGTIP